MRKQKPKQLRPGKGANTRTRTVTLPARFGIEEAAELHARLAPHLEAREPVEIEVVAPERVHTAALQVLAAFFRTRADAGRATRWRNPPAVVRDSATQLGLETALGLAATLI
jgi:hypothetical protein